jgi:hypothetical protein
MKTYRWSDDIASRLGRFILRKELPGTRCVGGWIDPRTDLNAVEKRKIPCLCR